MNMIVVTSPQPCQSVFGQSLLLY